MPTDDIHLNQVGLDKMWLHVLDKYIMPLTTKVFWGYYSNVSKFFLHIGCSFKCDHNTFL